MRHALLLLALPLPLAAPAEPAELAGMRFDLPEAAAGWTRAPAPAGIVLRRDR